MYEGSMKDFVCKMGYPLGSKYVMEEEWQRASTWQVIGLMRKI